MAPEAPPADRTIQMHMETKPNIGVIGNGSWATALVKILTDNRHHVNWWVRNAGSIDYIRSRRHNPNYLPSAYFDVSLLDLHSDLKTVTDRKSVV